MKKGELTDSILESIRTVNSQYQDMSGGSWLSDYGVESYLVSHMADRLLHVARTTKRTACVSLEERFVRLKEYSEAVGTPGPSPAILGKTARCDLALWSDYKTLYGVVEVKRQWTTSSCLKDLERLYTLMDRYGVNKGGRLSFACLAVFISKPRDNTGEKVTSMYERIQQRVKGEGYERVRFKALTPQHYKPIEYGDPDDSYQHYSCGGMTIELY